MASAVGTPLSLALLPRSRWPAPAPPASLEELRGLWVVRTALVSPETVDQVVDDAAAAGLNALFVQVRGRGDAFYSLAARAPERAPRAAAARLRPLRPSPRPRPGAGPPGARLGERAARGSLRAAACPSGHVLREPPRLDHGAALGGHGGLRRLAPRTGCAWWPEAGRAEGDVEGYYLSPSVPEAVDHLEAVVRELVRAYPVDGLHFDFIRYPGPTWDYSRAALEAFRQVHGTQALLGGPAQDPAAWDDYRRRTRDRAARAASPTRRAWSGRASSSRRRWPRTRRRR